MLHTRIQTPEGMKDFLPKDCALKKDLETRIRTTFERWGYSEVITPICEFMDVLSSGQSGVRDEALYKLFSRDGRTLILRPEMTTPIGRIVSSRLRNSIPPFRLCYVANVFRHTGTETGRKREFYQAGVELLGCGGPTADAEIVALAGKVLSEAGLTNVRFDIGHIGFVNALLDEAGLSAEEKEAIRQALVEKDFVGLKESLHSIERRGAAFSLLWELPKLRGDASFIQNLAEKITGMDRVSKALAEVADVIECLRDFNIAAELCVDLSMVKDFDYYTGIIMEGYIKELGAALCSGGRYDNLTEHFGYKCPATGFAVGIEWVMAALEKQGAYASNSSKGVIDAVAMIKCNRGESLKFVETLRDLGVKIALSLDESDFDKVKAYALEQGAVWLFILGESASSGELYNLANGHSHGRMQFDEIQRILHGGLINE